MARPLTEFIYAQNLPWTQGLPGAARDDVDVKILSQDNESGEMSLLVRYPAGWSRPEPEKIAAEEEMYVLDGAITINGHTYKRDSYMCLPQHFTRTNAVSETGCVALTFFDAVPAESKPGATPNSKAPHVEGLDVYAMRWDSKVADPSLEWMGNRRKVLRMDPEHNQKATFIISTPPHIYPENWACPTLTHPCAEESFMLSGDMIGPHGRMTTGSYFWRPAEIAHGPFGTRDGGMSLIRFRHGKHVNVWGAEQTPFSYDTAYQPAIPPALKKYATVYEGTQRF
ncbi:MAG: cupin domain-containing protein [Rhodospirillaceae bacterium]|nr:cupin domain-containing protein [Rhodospirillaceae bacterium]